MVIVVYHTTRIIPAKACSIEEKMLVFLTLRSVVSLLLLFRHANSFHDPTLIQTPRIQSSSTPRAPGDPVVYDIKSKFHKVSSVIFPALLTSFVISPRRVQADTESVDVSEAKKFVASMQDARPLASDEFVISFADESLNLRLVEEGYKGFPIVTVNGILDTELVVNHKELRIGAIVIQVSPIVMYTTSCP